MESSLTEIVAVLDQALEELNEFDGTGYGNMLRNGKDFYSKLRNGLNDMSDVLNTNIDQFQQVVQKLFQWNFALKELTDKYEKEKEIIMMENISTNGGKELKNSFIKLENIYNKNVNLIIFLYL